MPIAADEKIFRKLKGIFGASSVVPEWNVAKDSRDDLKYLAQYSPRIDFAIRPMNIDKNEPEGKDRIYNALSEKDRVVKRLALINDANHRELIPNKNPRCLLAFEIESMTGRKHRLGSILNASFIGAYGVIIAKGSREQEEESVYRSLIQIRNYVEFVRAVGKTKLQLRNVIITKRSSFISSDFHAN